MHTVLMIVHRFDVALIIELVIELRVGYMISGFVLVARCLMMVCIMCLCVSRVVMRIRVAHRVHIVRVHRMIIV